MRVITAARDAALAALLVAVGYYSVCASTSYAARPRRSPFSVSVLAAPIQRTLYPGDSVPVRLTLTNNTEHLLHLDSRAIAGNVSPLPRGCLASWFTLSVPPGSANVLGGNGGTATVTARLNFADTNTNQSDCAGVTLDVSLVVR